MFGGLELKGSAAGATASSKDEAATGTGTGTSDAAPPASSSFSFLNASSAGAPAPAATEASSSAFSFLNAGAQPSSASTPTPELVEVAAPAPASSSTNDDPPANSAFSFMAPSVPKPETPVEEPAKEDPSLAAAGSGFSFLSGGLATDTLPSPTTTETPQPTFAETTEAVAGAETDPPAIQEASQDVQNGFSFMGDGDGTAMSSATAMTMPAGAGITFAAVSGPTVGVKKKKKTRANRVGMGAGAPVPPSAPSVPQSAPVTQESSSTSTTADAASEAARRAEAFMQQKALESAASSATTTVDATPRESSSGFNPPDLHPAGSTDDVLAAAQRAAVEAKAQMARQTSASSSSSATNRFMSGFLKSFGGNKNDGTGKSGIAQTAAGGGRGATATKSSSSIDVPPIPSRASAISKQRSTGSSAPGTVPVADPVAKRNEDMKRAAAERELKQLQQRAEVTTAPAKSASLPPTTIESAAPDISTIASFTAATAEASPPSSSWQPPLPPHHKPIASLSSFKTTTSPILSILPTPDIVPAVAAVPKSQGLQKLEKLQWKFSMQVQQAWQDVQTTKSQQVMLQQERFLAMAKYQLCQQQIQQAEQQLQTAAEQEDYELAGQLSEIVEKQQAEQSEIDALLKSTERALEQVESQTFIVTKNVANCFDTLSNDLKQLQEQERESETDAPSSTHNLAAILEKFAEVSKMLSAEEERLSNDLKHLERDESLVQEERDELELTISEQSGKHEKEKEACALELQQTEETIVELRKQLEIELKRASELRTAKYGYDDQISKVRVKFSRQLNRVEKKERTVAENRSDWELESVSLKRQKDAHDLQVESHSRALLEQEELLQTIASEQIRCKEFIQLWDSTHKEQVENGSDGQNGDGSSDGDLAELQANVVKCEAAVKEAKLISKTANRTVASLEAEHAAFIQRIPQLEAEKKAAAARRDFKAAGKASKEMNDAINRSQIVSQELAGAASEKKLEAQAELQRCQTEYDEAKHIALEQESIQGKKQMESLARRIQKLHEVKKELLDKAQKQNGESTENAPDKMKKKYDVQEVGGKILNGQIEVLEEEGQSLGEKYGGWDELMATTAPPPAFDDDGVSDDNVELSADDSSPMEATETVPSTAVADQPAEAAESNNEDVLPTPLPKEPELSTEEKILKVRKLLQRVKQAEDDLEAAAQREDFEQAAELHEVFLALQGELEKINLTDEEMDLAISDAPIVAYAPSPFADAEKDDKKAPVVEETVPTESKDDAQDEVTPENGSEEIGPENGSDEGGTKEEAMEVTTEEDTRKSTELDAQEVIGSDGEASKDLASELPSAEEGKDSDPQEVNGDVTASEIESTSKVNDVEAINNGTAKEESQESDSPAIDDAEP